MEINAYAVMSIDGKISPYSKNSGKSESGTTTSWASKEDFEFFQKELSESDVIIVGGKTFRANKEEISKRNCIVITRTVKKFENLNSNIKYLNPEKVNLVDYLKEKTYKKVAVVGGSEIYSIVSGYIDNFFVTFEPLIFGRGISLLSSKAPKRLGFRSKRKLNESGTLLLRYSKTYKSEQSITWIIKMKPAIIVAMTKDFVIGNDNKLLWHNSEDLKNFKRLTSGSVVIMGRKTFESIGKPLPNRENIVITRTPQRIKGVHVVHDIKLAFRLAETFHRKIFVIGGAQIYSQTINLVDKLYVSWIFKEYEGDAHFPKIDFKKWEIVKKIEHEDWEFVEYERIPKRNKKDK